MGDTSRINETSWWIGGFPDKTEGTAQSSLEHRPPSPSGYPTFNFPVIVGWIVQCQPTVFELPSSRVNVCSVLSLFVTVSVTDPELTFTELGLKAKFWATIVALAA